MSTVSENPQIEVRPPSDPINFPVNTGLACKILNISISSLFLWEKKQGWKFSRGLQGTQWVRNISLDDLMIVLHYMQSLTYRDGSPIHTWLSDVDFTQPYKITTPSGFTITSNTQTNTEFK